jgi:hypothetical protein
MSWAAVIVGGASLVGGAVAARGAKDAAGAQGRAGDAAIAEQQRQFDTMLSLTSNQRGIGNQALNALGGIYGYTPAPGFSNDDYSLTQGGVNQLQSTQPVVMGDTELPPGAVSDSPGNPRGSNIFLNGQQIGRVVPGGPNGRFLPEQGVDISAVWKQWEDSQRVVSGGRDAGGNQLAAPDYSAFYQSPDYQFRMGQGLNAVQGSAAAQGGLYSGNALRSINDYAQGTAAGEFGNYVNRQLALAGMGQAATTQAGGAAMQTGANVGNLLMNQGNARASGIMGQSNAIVGGANDLASIYGAWRGGYFGGGAGGGNTSGNNLSYWQQQAMLAGGG